MSKVKIILIAIAALIVLGLAGYALSFYLKNQNPPIATTPSVVAPLPETTQSSQYSCPKIKAGSWINCMPQSYAVTPQPEPAECEANYRQWIQQNCPDVQFVD